MPDLWTSVDHNEHLVSLLEARVLLRGPADLVQAVASLFPVPPPWLARSPLGAPARILLEDDAPNRGSYRVQQVSGDTWVTTQRADLVPTAEALVATSIADQLSNAYLLFHAGAVAGTHGACLFPGSAGSGKSTLVAALQARHFACLGDDIVIYDDQVGKFLPFVKSITLKEGSSAVLKPIYECPIPEPTVGRFGEPPVSFVTPNDKAWPSESMGVRLIAFPVRQHGATARMHPISRAEALPQLLDQCFNHRRLGSRAVHASISLIRDCETALFYYDDLGEAIGLLEAMQRQENVIGIQASERNDGLRR